MAGQKPEKRPVGSGPVLITLQETKIKKTNRTQFKLPFDILSHCRKPKLPRLEEFSHVSRSCTVELQKLYTPTENPGFAHQLSPIDREKNTYDLLQKIF